MPTLQTAFTDFHDAIKLSDFDENATLREKRDILLDKLKSRISSDAASYTYFNQGSYAMHTGISPDDGDFDIDVGLRFAVDKEDYPDPTVLKKWVRDALDGHTKSVEIRKPCVTVKYQRDGESIYHVDFAIYAAGNADGKLYLACGKEFSEADNKFWEESDPLELIRLVREKFEETDAQQFRRVIRYLKKWKSQKFDSNGHAAPTGMSLTVLAYNLFSPNYTVDVFKNGARAYNDFAALRSLVKSIRQKFVMVLDENNNICYSICVNILTPPHNDLFEKMTLNQKTAFYNEVVKMDDILDKVADKIANNKPLSEQCELLQDLFGTDFPVLSDRSIVGTSESA